MTTQRLIVIMGPSGCGKSSVAASLAEARQLTMLEGDDFHPDENVAKMADGIALNDRDRAAWLDNLMAAINTSTATTLVLACSALTSYVQRRLTSGTPRQVIFALLDAPKDVLAERLTGRADHFMPASLLDSQLAALSPPVNAIRIDATGTVEAITAHLRERLNQQT